MSECRPGKAHNFDHLPLGGERRFCLYCDVPEPLDESEMIELVNTAGERLVETVDPGGYYNKHDTTGITVLYHRARDFCDAIDELGFIPVQLERRSDT